MISHQSAVFRARNKLRTQLKNRTLYSNQQHHSPENTRHVSTTARAPSPPGCFRCYTRAICWQRAASNRALCSQICETAVTLTGPRTIPAGFGVCYAVKGLRRSTRVVHMPHTLDTTAFRKF